MSNKTEEKKQIDNKEKFVLEEPLEWRSFPLVDYPKSSIFLSAFIIFFAWLLWDIAVVEWHMFYYYLLGMLIFVLSLGNYFFPTYYIIDNNTVTIDYTITKIKKNFTDFRCFYADKKGVMLGTFMRPRRIDRFRGISIRFSKDQAEKDSLMKLLESKNLRKY